MEQKLIRMILQVEGMTDGVCEQKIENELNAINGIVNAKAIQSSSNVYITYDANTVTMYDFIAAIEKLGFKVRNKPSSLPAASGKYSEKVLKVDGMTCSSCEMRIENKLKKMKGVVSVKASFASSRVNVTYNPGQVGLDTIVETIEKLDYRVVGKDGGKMDGVGSDKLSINQLLGIGIIILAAYVIIKNTVGFNFIPQVNANMGYGILFTVGLITSLHCIAMCGGINLSQCVSYKFAGTQPGKYGKLKPSLLYNMGRVVSYTVIGGIVGGLGSVISFSGTAKGIVAIISGVFMVIMGLNMLNIFPWLRKFNPRMPRIFGNKLHNGSGNHGPLYVGMLNGLMPCGPLQAMQIYALGTGSILAGALSMLVFSLGTVPLMFGFGAVSTLLSGRFTRKMMKVSAVLVMILGVIMLNRGLSLSGINVVYAASGGPASGNIAKIEGGVQTVTTNLESGKYPPIVVQKGIPVKWNMKADAKNINGCNETVTIPKFNIQKKLVPGDNIIEFTPDAAGNIPYTCWMGMISSNIKVVDDINKVSSSEIAQALGSGSSSSAGLGGGCCGATPPGFANGKIPTDNIQVAAINGNQQEVTVTVNNQGYSPAVVVLQKGVQAKIKFNPEQLSGCNSTVVFPEFQGQIDLQSQTETPLLTPDKDFTFQCSMNMLHGYVKVVDDIKNVDLDAIRKEIQNYKPSGGSGSFGGGGGCCG